VQLGLGLGIMIIFYVGGLTFVGDFGCPLICNNEPFLRLLKLDDLDKFLVKILKKRG
jgi:hypothetical protein